MRRHLPIPPPALPALLRTGGIARRAVLALALSVLLVPPAIAAPAAPAPGVKPAATAANPAATAKPSATGTRPAAAAPRRVLPDSVLLRINDREDVTRRRFERAVRLLGGRPDSLTPGDRDRFLDMVLEQRLLAAQATQKPLAWDRQDSLQFLAECDNVYLRAALSDRFYDLETRRRAQGLPDLDEQAMGLAARESLMVELHPVWDTELLKLIGSYFAELPNPTPDMGARQQMALAAMAPKIPATDTAKVLVRTTLGPFTVADMLADWRRLSSLYKPRVRDDAAVKDLVQNGLFERVIREASRARELRERPIVQSVLADRIEYHSVTTYLQHAVIASIPMDSLTLWKHYRAHQSDFDRPASAALVILTLETEHAADSLARLFTVPGEAESLAFRAQRNGVRYTLQVSERSDSALFRRAMNTGVGGVGGPERVEGGWRVYKVLSSEPRHSQAFDIVRPAVEQSWNETESERRVRALLDSLKRQAKIERNERALRALVVANAAAPRKGPR